MINYLVNMNVFDVCDSLSWTMELILKLLYENSNDGKKLLS